jgi:uncharacterized protein YdaU (DUF1376 family)
VGKVRWYKRDPDAALSGMAGLTLEERGAFNTILDLIYSHDGKVDDDERFIAGWLRCDVRIWKRIRQRLIDLEKLYVNGNTLRNRRADREVDAALHRIVSAAEAGLASAAKRHARRNAFNGLLTTAVERSFVLPTTTKKITSSEQEAARERPHTVSQPPALPSGLQARRPSDLSRVEIEATFKPKASR